MTKFAVAHYVPKRKLHYITPGKRYPMRNIDENSLYSFEITDDKGDTLFCLRESCAHLDGGSWEIIDDAEPASSRHASVRRARGRLQRGADQ